MQLTVGSLFSVRSSFHQRFTAFSEYFLFVLILTAHAARILHVSDKSFSAKQRSTPAASDDLSHALHNAS